MAYEPTTWASGDTITATKMNKIEQGIANGGGAFVVNDTLSGGTHTLDKTWNEIYTAFSSGKNVLVSDDGTSLFSVLSVYGDDGYGYYVTINRGDSSFNTFSTDTSDGYPAHQPK